MIQQPEFQIVTNKGPKFYRAFILIMLYITISIQKYTIMRTNQKIPRFPRGMGMTELASLANKGDNTALVNLTNYAIQTWIVNNGSLWGKIYSILELARFLKCDPIIIQNKIKEVVLDNRLFDKSKTEETLESLTGALISWTLEDRMEISQQLALLRASQGDGYTPFVTGEVNKALALKQSSTTSMQSLIRTLSGGGSVNIFQQNNQYNQQNNQYNGLSRDEAMEMIQKEIADKGGMKELEYVEGKYDFLELPEIIATKQGGNVGQEKEGLTLKNHEIDAIISDYAGASEAFEEDHHDIRREIEQCIDMEAEDPELN